MKTETAGPPAPAEALIPEARQHQRQRYRRGGSFLVIAALVIAALVASALLLWHGPAAEGKSRSDPKPAAATSASGLVYFRPVLCFAAPYAAPSGSTAASRGTEPIPACSAASVLSAANVGVTPQTGTPSGSTPPDQQYASYPSSSTRTPGYASRTVLLPAVNGACDGTPAVRCVLGPVEMTSRSVGKVTVTRDHGSSGWIVNYTMAGAGASALWDKVAYENFHQFLGIELGGVVYTAPLIQPSQSSFSSFDGRGEISGNFSRGDALHLARALSTHKG
jgi:hypothetical protein